jgi:hypothetical protein
MAKTIIAHTAQESTHEQVECFRHEGEDCPRCDGARALGYASVVQGAESPLDALLSAVRLLWVSGTVEARVSPCGAVTVTQIPGSWTHTGRALRGWSSGFSVRPARVVNRGSGPPILA